MNGRIAIRFREELLQWGDEHCRKYPWRRPDASLYEVFVAEFFLTQTPAENVASVYPTFLEEFPSLAAINEATEAELAAVIEPLGFQNMRANALSAIAATTHELPTEVDELTDLLRVGPYVANATLCFAFDRQLPIVDRNVDRIYGRVFGDEWPDRTADQWEAATELVPRERPRAYNLALLDFAAATCRPDPRCDACFATDYCYYYRNERA